MTTPWKRHAVQLHAPRAHFQRPPAAQAWAADARTSPRNACMPRCAPPPPALARADSTNASALYTYHLRQDIHVRDFERDHGRHGREHPGEELGRVVEKLGVQQVNSGDAEGPFNKVVWAEGGQRERGGRAQGNKTTFQRSDTKVQPRELQHSHSTVTAQSQHSLSTTVTAQSQHYGHSTVTAQSQHYGSTPRVTLATTPVIFGATNTNRGE